MPKNSKLEKVKEEVVKMYNVDHKSATEIAKKYLCTVTTVTSLLKKKGINIREKTQSISMAWDRRKEDTVVFTAYIEKLSERLSGRVFSAESRKQMSSTRSERIASGEINHRTYGKSEHYKGFFVRSSYERRFVDLCEELHITIEPCKYLIPYIGKDGNYRTYIPDFYDPIKARIFEIKPVKLKQTKTNQLKFKAAKEFCKERGITFHIITEHTLFNYPIFREDYE